MTGYVNSGPGPLESPSSLPTEEHAARRDDARAPPQLPPPLAGDADPAPAREGTEPCGAAAAVAGATDGAEPPLTCRTICAALGPGLLACLAGSEAGGVVTAAQSGAQYGYSFAAMYIGLVPLLYLAQELTCRLGISTGKGISELAWIYIGPWAGITSCVLNLTNCVAGIVGELRGIAGAFHLYGVPLQVSTLGTVAVLTAVVASGSYRSAERVCYLFGVTQLVFIAAAVLAEPAGGDVAAGVYDGVWPSRHSGDNAYRMLVAANFGTTVTPWMLYYQQGALKARDPTGDLPPAPSAQDFTLARIDTALGSLLTQLVMIGTLVCYAATVWVSSPVTGADGWHVGVDMSDEGVGGTVAPLYRFFGTRLARVLFAAGLAGSSLLAALVLCLTMVWSVEELQDAYRHVEAERAADAPAPEQRGAHSQSNSRANSFQLVPRPTPASSPALPLATHQRRSLPSRRSSTHSIGMQSGHSAGVYQMATPPPGAVPPILVPTLPLFAPNACNTPLPIRCARVRVITPAPSVPATPATRPAPSPTAGYQLPPSGHQYQYQSIGETKISPFPPSLSRKDTAKSGYTAVEEGGQVVGPEGTGAVTPQLQAGVLCVVLLACSVVSWQVRFVDVQIWINVLYALTCPPCIALLIYLSANCRVLPDSVRVKGLYLWMVTVLLSVCCGVAFYAAIAGMF